MVLRARVRFHADDIWDAPEDGNHYEVVDGALYITPVPNMVHQLALSALMGRLLVHVDTRMLGRVIPSLTAVVLDEEYGVQPDLAFVSRERLHILSERGVEGAPDLVVEILSPRTQSHDRGVKKKRYAAAGVRHYWIVAPQTFSIEEYRLSPGATTFSQPTDLEISSNPTSSPAWRFPSMSCGSVSVQELDIFPRALLPSQYNRI